MDPAVPDGCSRCRARLGCVFADLSPALCARFRGIARTRFYGRGATIVRQGERAHGVFVLQDGVLRLSHVDSSGRVALVRHMVPSGILGITEAATGSRYQLTAEAACDSRLEYVTKKAFVTFLMEEREVAVPLLAHICNEFERLQRDLCDWVERSPLVERLVHKLLDLSETTGIRTDAGTMIGLPLTVRDLAESVGCSRQWASKTLSEIEQRGFIVRRRGRIVVTDFARSAMDGLGRCERQAVDTAR